MRAAVLTVLAGAAALVAARPDRTAHRRHAHSHTARSPLPEEWYHPRGHPVEELFSRQNAQLPYPPQCQQGGASGDPSTMPMRWVAAYNAAKNAGQIPDIPPTTLNAAGNPEYPGALNGSSQAICSGTLKCPAVGDIWDAPDGVIVISFDDGPLAIGPTLYEFLRTENVSSTHFMIGCAILGSPDVFQQAFTQNHASIAAHTWSHPYMTTLTDLQQVAEMGWVMQIISDQTGGRVPRFWRPPHGDCDNRCRAIATHVFGLTTVFWNHDSEDWQISSGTYPGSWVIGNITQFMHLPKSPGLIILEHELSNDTVQIFENTTFPLAKTLGWKMQNLVQAVGGQYYLNAAADVGAVSSSGIIASTAPASDSTLPPYTPPSASASSTSTSTVTAVVVVTSPSGAAATPVGGAATPGAVTANAPPTTGAASPRARAAGAGAVGAAALALVALLC